MRLAPTIGLSLLVASMFVAGCGSAKEASTSTKGDRPETTTSTTKPDSGVGTGNKLVPQAKLTTTLLTAAEAGAGWTLVSSGTSQGTAQPGPSTSKPNPNQSGPSLSNVKTTPQCKAVLKNFDLTTKVDATVARAAFTKADRTALVHSVISSTANKSQPAADRAGLAKCKNISINTGLGKSTLGLTTLDLPKLGDDSLGVKLTVTKTGQGKTLTQHAYLAEIQRGNTVDIVLLADGASPDGTVTAVDSAKLAGLARTADTKVAKVT